MKKSFWTLILFCFLLAGLGQAQTMPLNTGFNHDMNVQAAYPNPAPVSTTRDDYWINIASFPPTNPPVDRSFAILPPGAGWQPAMPNSRWISARSTHNTAPGIGPDNPGYTIFRKCFCLVPGFKNAQLNLQARGDDNITVWLNTTLNQVVAPTSGRWNLPTPVPGSTSSGFRVGKNCLYVLLEDTVVAGSMGLNLVGTVSAIGLQLPPAKGTAQSFEPCSCREAGPVGPTGNAAPNAKVANTDQQVVAEIVKFAEARRTAKRVKK